MLNYYDVRFNYSNSFRVILNRRKDGLYSRLFECFIILYDKIFIYSNNGLDRDRSPFFTAIINIP